MCAILDTTYSMLIDLGLPTIYWSKAIQIVVYLQNLIPLKGNLEIISAKALYSIK